MSEYNATTPEGQAKDVGAYVANEANSARKSVKMNLIMAGVLFLLFTVYFMVLNHYIKKATEPKELASTASAIIKHNIPDLAKMLEKVLNDTSPQVADFIANKAVDQGVPYLKGKSKEYIDTYIDQFTAIAANNTDQAFNDVVTTNKDALLEALKCEPETPENPCQALGPLRDRLHASFEDPATGKPTEAKDRIDKSLIALRNLSKRLKELAKKDVSKMSRKEAMGSRLLSTYWMWMRHRNPDDVGVNAPEGTVGDETP